MFRLQVPYKTKPVLTSIIYFTYYFLGIYTYWAFILSVMAVTPDSQNEWLYIKSIRYF